ncbi:MAG TPA: non-heme iron oxygenase ferredoxin subunit [Solirubrobacteraceae bacterium]|nr:non-heme iron oxygenase ferredoxin subunit [Solirubrobacteraceae bacterium]
MRFVRVADLRELAEGKRVVAELEEHEILVVSLAECVYAIGNICTHDEVWLDDGILHPETCEIECPMHEGRFDLRTGVATHEPAEDPVPSYPVRIEGDDVFVGIPS